MLFDGSTIRPKRRLVSSMPEDLEGFRAKYEIIANVWRMMKLQTPGRAVLVGLTENTWGNPPEWLKAPGWQLLFVVRAESSGSSDGPDPFAMHCR